MLSADKSHNVILPGDVLIYVNSLVKRSPELLAPGEEFTIPDDGIPRFTYSENSSGSLSFGDPLIVITPPDMLYMCIFGLNKNGEPRWYRYEPSQYKDSKELVDLHALRLKQASEQMQFIREQSDMMSTMKPVMFNPKFDDFLDVTNPSLARIR